MTFDFVSAAFPELLDTADAMTTRSRTSSDAMEPGAPLKETKDGGGSVKDRINQIEPQGEVIPATRKSIYIHLI